MWLVRPGVRRSALCLAAALLVARPGLCIADVVLAVAEPGGAPAGDIVVALTGGPPGSPEPRRDMPVVIDQRDKSFVPAITVVQTGTQVAFPNNDATSHHVYSFSKPNAFELPLYKGDLHRPVRFNNPGIVTLGCNIHDFMVGYVVVVDTPWFGITTADGTVTVAGVPPGRYDVAAWSARLDRGRFQSLGSVVVGPSGEERQALVLPRPLRGSPVRASHSLVQDAY
jgi:plastocyanin